MRFLLQQEVDRFDAEVGLERISLVFMPVFLDAKKLVNYSNISLMILAFRVMNEHIKTRGGHNHEED